MSLILPKNGTAISLLAFTYTPPDTLKPKAFQIVSDAAMLVPAPSKLILLLSLTQFINETGCNTVHPCS